jgi:hypothetical protein
MTVQKIIEILDICLLVILYYFPGRTWHTKYRGNVVSNGDFILENLNVSNDLVYHIGGNILMKGFQWFNVSLELIVVDNITYFMINFYSLNYFWGDHHSRSNAWSRFKELFDGKKVKWAINQFKPYKSPEPD